jgi:hypothetical protein
MLNASNLKLLVGIMLALLAALLAFLGTTPAPAIAILIIGITLIATSRRSTHA